ncbi:hypothetical protein [Allomesorhizobium alhagi]|nr:hypothetical protein [Mesorhizobium alhagi]
MSLIRRAATLSVWCESADAEMAKGRTIDIGLYTTTANTLRRLLTDLGLSVTTRQKPPPAASYFQTRKEASA